MSDPFIILSLSGGGFCGLYTACILEKMERARGNIPVCKSVDLIAGTSIGGIIALGLSHGALAESIRVSFDDAGPSIFCDDGPYFRRKRRNLQSSIRQLFSSKYRSEPLRAVVEEIISDKKFLESCVPTVISSVSINSGAPFLFRNYDMTNMDLKSADVAMATSAAPTYFDPHRIGAQRFIDGGIVANNPDVIAICDAIKYFNAKIEDIYIVSIGAISQDMRSPSVDTGFNGILRNAFNVRRAISFSLEVQQTLSCELAGGILGDRYCRINTAVSGRLAKSVGMDMADREAISTLKDLAETKYRELQASMPVRIIENGELKSKERWREGRLVAPMGLSL